MPAKSHGKKRYTKNTIATPAAGAAVPESGKTGVATAVKPEAKPNPVLSTQPEPRRSYVGKELVRVGVVSVIVIAALIVLFFVLR